MRIEEVILQIKAKQFSMMESVFKIPPQDYEAFKQQLGVWMGLNESLRIIEDARKKEQDD